MKIEIHYSKESRRDMDDIWEYIARELQNPSAAERTLDRIMDDVDQLEKFPEIGTPLPSLTGGNSGFRFLVSGNYLIFYRVCGQEVYVDRVLYGGRDYLRILLGNLPHEEQTE